MKRSNLTHLEPVREFFKVVRTGDHKKVKNLLKEKVVNVNATDPDDSLESTAIIVASELQDVAMVRILMRAKPEPANVNAENKIGKRAIWYV